MEVGARGAAREAPGPAPERGREGPERDGPLERVRAARARAAHASAQEPAGRSLHPAAKRQQRVRVGFFAACVLLVLSVLLTRWPVHVAFQFSRPALERLADRVERGEMGGLPQRAGVFRVERAERTPSGAVCLWLADGVGLVRVAPGITDVNFELRNVWCGHGLCNTWEFGYTN